MPIWTKMDKIFRFSQKWKFLDISDKIGDFQIFKTKMDKNGNFWIFCDKNGEN